MNHCSRRSLLHNAALRSEEDRSGALDLQNGDGETWDVAAQHSEVVDRLMAFAVKIREELSDNERLGKAAVRQDRFNSSFLVKTCTRSRPTGVE